jgi:Uma2 family endonuclease
MLAARPRLTYEDYCRIEADGAVRHEFLDGQAWAMAGGSRLHAAICANVIASLVLQLRGRPCQAHTSDLRVRVRATGLATYPDASVLCGRAELDPEDPRGHAVTNPVLLVEVLSPSTEEYDRGEKFAHYRRIESLQEVVFVAQDRARIEVWSRQSDGTWTHAEHREGTVPLGSIACSLVLADVYRDPLGGEQTQ